MPASNSRSTPRTPHVGGDALSETPSRLNAACSRLAEHGLAPFVDPTHGALWLSDADPTGPIRVTGQQLDALAAPLRAALHARDGAPTACAAGRCAVDDGPVRWIIAFRRAPEGRLVAGVHRTRRVPPVDVHARWLEATAAPWRTDAAPHIGAALSYEESFEYDNAIAALRRARAADPDSAWPVYHLARMHVLADRPRDGYVFFRLSLTHDGPEVAAALEHLRADDAMRAFRGHSAVKPFAAPPPAPRTTAELLEQLRARRGAARVLDQLRGPDAPSLEVLRRLLEATLLVEPTLTPDAIAWDELTLTVVRDGGAAKVGPVAP